MVNYGGDEVAALVVDIGASTLRAGYAGDDTPKAVIPTAYGFHPPTPDGDVSMTETAESGEPKAKSKFSKIYVGSSGPSIWREGMEVGNPIVDGLVNDFEPIPHLVEHALTKVMRCSPSDHPILVTEPSWNTQANRERMAEIMFEEFHVPAFYIANTGVLNAFAAGKGSALVVDIGHSMSSVTPVVDGFVLRKGLSYSALPMLIQAHARHILVTPTQHRRGIELIPHQLIGIKTQVDPGQPPQYTLRQDRVQGTTASWRTWAETREIDEWLQSVGGVSEQGWNDQMISQRTPRQYEFPTGYSAYFATERYELGEHLFAHTHALQANNPNLPQTIPSLITEALRACDPELRQVLVSNVVVTGGGSLFSGFVDRLANELARSFPHTKIHAPGNPIERRYGGWLGGSILASLGTFHQLWISQEEWKEHGKLIVGQRCK